MATVDLLAQLEEHYQKSKPPSKKRLDEKSVYRIYDDLCKIYPTASSNDRIDIQIFFAGKSELLELLTSYLSSITTKATQAAARDKLNIATPLIQQGLVVDAIIDGRTHSPLLEEAHHQLLQSAEKVHFDLPAYAKTLEVPIGDYFRRAQHFHQVYDRANAARTLGHILQLNPSLQNNTKVASLAASITGQSAESAVETLGSAFLCEQFISELELGNKPRSKVPHFEPQLRVEKTPIRPRKTTRKFSKSQTLFINIGLTLLGMVLMIGITIGIALLIEQIFPSERGSLSLSEFGRRASRNISLMPILGLVMVLTGLVATIRREIDLSQFLNTGAKGDEYAFSGPAAFVLGLFWTAAGILFFGSGLSFFEGIGSFGFLTEFLSNPYKGLALVIGIVIAMVIVGIFIRKMTPKSR